MEGIAKKRVKRKETNENNNNNVQKSEKQDEVVDEKDSFALSFDVINDILARLPPKPVSKLFYVSKLWASIIRGKDFTQLYLTRYSTQLRLLFTVYRGNTMRFYHSSQHNNPSSSGHKISITPNPVHIPVLGNQISPPIRGLICSRAGSEVVICNPCTGQSQTLPPFEFKTTTRAKAALFFGYDPVSDLYKVLAMTETTIPHRHETVVSQKNQVYTLGAQEKSWRMIRCKYPHCPATQGICREGVIYYGAWSQSYYKGAVIISFDLRFEEFSLIPLPESVQIKRYDLSGLVNYKGSLALVNQSSNGRFDFWVLKDVKKQEWMKVSLLIPSWKDLVGNELVCCRGTISTGELIFAVSAPRASTNQVFVLYYDPKEDKARKVEFERIGDHFVRMCVYLDHVESPMYLSRE